MLHYYPDILYSWLAVANSVQHELITVTFSRVNKLHRLKYMNM